MSEDRTKKCIECQGEMVSVVFGVRAADGLLENLSRRMEWDIATIFSPEKTRRKVTAFECKNCGRLAFYSIPHPET